MQQHAMNLRDWLDLLERRHPKEIELGLERCGTVYRELGSPRPGKIIFTVAGTNGKGSTVAYLAAMSGALGQRFGCYTSPHIFRFNERISIMGEPVTDEQLVQAFQQVEAARKDVSLTYFEFTTLAAFLIMHHSNLDCAVLEVGLGGRLDTVNLIDADCVIITPIGLDHQDFLGPDLVSIAREKAGVIRAGAPVVSTRPDPPAPILHTANALAAPLFRRGVDYDLVSTDGSDDDDGMLRFSLGGQSFTVPKPPMAGEHQLDNLAAALAGFVLLNPSVPGMGQEISTAIRLCKLPGRLQTVSISPEIILDVGHNELAAKVVADFLEQNQVVKMTCVLAMLEDKPAGKVAHAMGHLCKRWLCADSYGSRGQTGNLLAQRIQKALPDADVCAFEQLDDAMSEAVEDAAGDETILVFGSFTTVEVAARWLQNRLRHDRHDAAKITANKSETCHRGNLNG